MAEPTKKIKVLLVEDDAVFRLGLSLMLRNSPQCLLVGEAEDGESALQLIQQMHPDLLLLDLGLPGLGGRETLLAVKQRYPQLKVLVLTSREEGRLVQQMLQAGADGYCLKGVTPEHLLRVIEEVSAGHGWLDSKVLGYIREALAHEPAVDLAREQAAGLTEREREVLSWMAKGASNPEIGQHLHISSGTVRVHVHAILRKLGVGDRTQAVVVALERGLLAHKGQY
ncbi:response regulator [Anthocerotibacter panamensis]|uniref:response regulator n=1 Tax=Anthocerotibacter panamensis TaxID=2857077 RepID=UPI001C4014DA|nr:response regulator transcription factor [Anthocerotibacter panamensis]